MDRFDYVLVDEKDAQDLRVTMETRAEKCPDEEASALWHRNLLQLTASQLYGLVRATYQARRIERVLPPDVMALIQAGLARGELDRAKVNEKLLLSLAPAPPA